MPVRLVDQIEKGAYLQDGKRMLRVLSLTAEEALCEDSVTFEAEALSMRDIARRWRRVHPSEES